MLAFEMLEIPTDDGQSIISVEDTLGRAPGQIPAKAVGMVSILGCRQASRLIGQTLHAYIASARFIEAFPEFARRGSHGRWARVPMFISAADGSEVHPCRIAGPPSFVSLMPSP